jgi:AcrR family transcriptional regulator
MELESYFGSSKGDQTKSKILRSAIDVLSSQGLGHFTFDAVALPIGMQRAQVAYHFPKKETLIAEAIRYAYRCGADIVEAEMSRAPVQSLAHLKAYIVGTLKWIDHDPAMRSLLCLALYLATIDPVFAEVMTDVKRAGTHRVERILNDGQGSRSARELKTLAHAVHSYIVGEVIAYMTTPTTNHTQTIYQGCLRMLHA